MLLTDGYKVDHRRQYPKETTKVVSNFTPRTSRVDGVTHVIWFGKQYFIKKYIIEEFNNWFKTDRSKAVKAYKRRIDHYLPPNHGVTFEHIGALHDLQYIPLEIKALPEGARVPLKVPPISITNTLDEFYWLVNYIETLMSCVLWGPSTSATTSHQYRKIFNKWAMKTVGNTDFVQFQGHDFSFRGMFGVEAAEMSGAGHLLNFVGTDTIPAIDWLEKYYNADCEKELIGCSVAATEHAVMCVGTGFFIRKDNLTWERYGDAEYAVFERLLTEVYPTGIVSVVSDTWNLWKVISEYLPKMKELILARDGKLVIRPDSGDPVQILTGHPENWKYTYDEYLFEEMPSKAWTVQEYKGVVQCLWDIFGGTISMQGYKILDPHIGTIYGDSITTARAEEICQRLANMKFASINWVAGIGSYTYQYVTRDTYGWAMKATYAEANYEGEVFEIPIFKDPVTDSGTKKSAKGLLAVFKDANDEYFLVDECDKTWANTGELQPVFRDGKILVEETLSEIRERVSSHLKTKEKELVAK